MIVLYITIYLVLYVLTYYTNRYIMKKSFPKLDWNMSDVYYNLFASLWIGFSSLIIFILHLSDRKYSNNKPPKWL